MKFWDNRFNVARGFSSAPLLKLSDKISRLCLCGLMRMNWIAILCCYIVSVHSLVLISRLSMHCPEYPESTYRYCFLVVFHRPSLFLTNIHAHFGSSKSGSFLRAFSPVLGFGGIIGHNPHVADLPRALYSSIGTVVIHHPASNAPFFCCFFYTNILHINPSSTTFSYRLLYFLIRKISRIRSIDHKIERTSHSFKVSYG